MAQGEGSPMLDDRTTTDSRESAGAEPLRLTRALTHDLRASLHGLALLLEMLSSAMSAESTAQAGRYLGMARAEAAQLDRLVEQIGLWIRVISGEYRVRHQRLDLAATLSERLGEWARLTAGAPAVTVSADRQLLQPSLDGLRDFLAAYVSRPDEAGVELTPDGQMRLFGPPSLQPVLRTVAAGPVPDLQAAKGPAMWLVGPSLAVSACRACGGEVWLDPDGALILAWPIA